MRYKHLLDSDFTGHVMKNSNGSITLSVKHKDYKRDFCKGWQRACSNLNRVSAYLETIGYKRKNPALIVDSHSGSFASCEFIK